MSDKARWDIEVAKKFKERTNKRPLGPMLGKILKPLPEIQVELLNGKAIIDADKIYLSNAITNRLAIECTMEGFESVNNTAKDMESSGNTISGLSTSGGGSATSLVNHSGSVSKLSLPAPSNSKENKEKGKFKLQTIFYLKPGMYVLVIPNEEEDKFFIIDVFKYAPEVSLDWEYYQK